MARGRSLLLAGDAKGARPLLAEALDLWRGEPYADWPDSAFADVERRRLEGVWVNATVAFFEAELELGRHEDSVPELEPMVTEQPLNESWWSPLVVALYRSGRQADALAAVRRARSHLADELGLDPGPRLRRA